jgi:zinc protease
MKKLLLLLCLLSLSQVSQGNYIDDNLKKLSWNGIEVVWLEDNSLPTYDFSIYFKEGAFGDAKGKYGETQLMFDQLSSGTSKYKQRDILEKLEFFGSSIDSSITHEFSSVNVSGLVKDMKPTLEMMCHLFNSATFPQKKLDTYKARLKSSITNIVTKHSALANLIFRYESLKGSGYENPVKGNLKSINNITRSDLVTRLKHFNSNVVKRIYIKGPSEVLNAESIVTQDCKWKKTAFDLPLNKVAVTTGRPEILFVSIPEANQAQIRVGRIMNTSEVSQSNHELKSYSSTFLGGGFTSRLVQRLRVDKGLTYSAGSYVSEQRSYGRSGISTFTKSESIIEMLSSIQEVLKESTQKVSKANFDMSKRHIKGNYLLSLESTSDFLQNLQYFDHIGRNYSEIYKFTERIDRVTQKDLTSTIDSIFNWDNQVKLILGNKNLIKKIKKAGYKVKEIDYKNYL